jgi:16S rRNA (cytosine967-C5)-methyltransferase
MSKTTKKEIEPRLLAVKWLTQVVSNGRSVNDILANDQHSIQPQHKSLAKQLLFGCLRYFHQLKTISDNLLEKPFKAKDQDLLIIIILGLYQLKYLSTPDHAAISESVELSRSINKKWAAGLINGVLRRYQREADELTQSLSKSLQFQYSHPGWMVKKLQQDWPHEFADLLQQNNIQAPMFIRVNSVKNDRQQYLTKLEQANIAAQPHAVATNALLLEQAVDVMALPGFIDGDVTVQDAAAQLPIELLDLQPQQKVLDGCAAPGGKTTHILQSQPTVALTSVEMSARRAEKISQTLSRMQMQCQLKVADITDIDSWWDGQLFDRILLDVPCSASGVIRRNPDIKVHRKVTDIKPLLAIQAEILAKCWALLKPNGILVYATCSVFKDENQHQMNQFLQNHQAETVDLAPEIAAQLASNAQSRASIGYQIFPGDNQMDGFYFCGLRKLTLS